MVFHVFRHAEDFTSAYNVQLFKFDHETGQPLENARFVLYERFDDKGEVNTERDGPANIYKGEVRMPAITRTIQSSGIIFGESERS